MASKPCSAGGILGGIFNFDILMLTIQCLLFNMNPPLLQVHPSAAMFWQVYFGRILFLKWVYFS